MTNTSINQIHGSLRGDLEQFVQGIHGAPFDILGPHEIKGTPCIVTYVPGAARVAVQAEGTEFDLPAVDGLEGCFAGPGPADKPYRLKAEDAAGRTWRFDDPYRFYPRLGDLDMHLLGEGTHRHLWRVLGAHPCRHQDAEGTHFAVWAPNARRVSVVGPFNNWDGRRHIMRHHAGIGVWEIFLPGIGAGEIYKYELLGPDGALLPLKADPVGFGSEMPPMNASVVRDLQRTTWKDAAWMTARAASRHPSAPMSIYEVHLGSWKNGTAGRMSYEKAAKDLIDYAVDMGFTHIELMPISEHPFDGSWGYQPVGLFAPTVRYGPPDGLRALVAAAHQAGMGVLLDWVIGHFPTDEHGLARFDGTALYEYGDPREGFHPEWNTYIYDYSSPRVRNLLLANALYWLEEYHIDGLRVDAVASMLYRDYARAPGEWLPNENGGRENLEAISLLREINGVVREAHPGSITVAEESTAFPGVTRPHDADGLGFDFKWNMGWTHDTLEYIRQPPSARPQHHHKMTFGLTYAFSENFVLPISHDEVPPGKGGMLDKMPGDTAQKFANLRAYYAFMWGHPGKKLLFMGQEFGHPGDWSHDVPLGWACLKNPSHLGMQRLVRALNQLYREQAALHKRDGESGGFEWIEADDTQGSVYVWLRRGNMGDPPIVVVCNFSDRHHGRYRVGLLSAGEWRVRLNTDDTSFGGEGRGTTGKLTADQMPYQGQNSSAELDLPPLSCLFLQQIA